jgi:ABC-type uncharacterized transport system fused permease/ATPase subunit
MPGGSQPEQLSKHSRPWFAEPPPLLVFDEATRALDTESKGPVTDNLDQQLQGLSTVGTPREGLYYYMCRRQLAL